MIDYNRPRQKQKLLQRTLIHDNNHLRLVQSCAFEVRPAAFSFVYCVDEAYTHVIAVLAENAVALMLRTVSGTVIDASFEQPLKAWAPIDVTLLGTDTDVIDVQLAKA